MSSNAIPLFSNTKQQPQFAFPSPPPSIGSGPGSDNGLDFDLESFTHCSDTAATPLDHQLSFDFISASTPSSTHLVSPKSSISLSSIPSNEISDLSSFGLDGVVPDVLPTGNTAAEALSNHHLERYFHYKALAAQAEAAATAACQADSSFDALFGTFPMSGDQNPAQNDMLAYQQTAPSYYTPQVPTWNQSYSYQPDAQAQAQAAALHSQAQAHMQAHDLALARAQRQSMPVMNYYMPSSRSTVQQAPPPTQMWSRQSVSTVSTTSPPFPSTPSYSAPAPMDSMMTKSSTSTSLPTFATMPMAPPSRAPSEGAEGEIELDEDEIEITSDNDVKPAVPSMAVANPHGGGRGYVPGKTPEDPKKKHKCQVCGRGFARAFNLKSHIQTHNPLRSKPYQCPHASCKRGFSRLHDLERHRQGIHSDGPLVDAKRQGVPPAIARAQHRIQKRAESGGLI